MSMEIGGAYGSFLQNYRVPTIPSVSVEDVRKQESRLQKMRQNPITPTYEEPSVPAVRKPDAQLEDLSVTFNRQDDFGYIGRNSDIRSLDVERAISDMKKDQVLQQYQYFVGSSGKLADQGRQADGLVIPRF